MVISGNSFLENVHGVYEYEQLTLKIEDPMVLGPEILCSKQAE